MVAQPSTVVSPPADIVIRRGKMRCSDGIQKHMCCKWLLVLQAFASFTSGSAWSARPPTYRVVTGDGVSHKSLYPQHGPVQPLTGESGASAIAQDNNIVWIVEYYDFSCPHCWYFSSILPTVAKALKSSKVRVGAVNCLDKANALTCHKAKATSFPFLVVYNAVVPGDRHHIHLHNKKSIDDPLPAKAIATMISTLAKGRAPIVNSEVFKSGAGFSGGADHLVKISGPPGKDGWTNEEWGTVQTRFHDAHVGMARLLMDGYVSKTKYQAALDVVQFVGKVFGKDENQVFSDLTKKLKAKSDLEPLEFRKIMGAWADQFNQKWVFCKTKTCAVWQLFHCITSLIAIRYAPIAVSEALPKFRFMVTNFLDCEDCRQHFVKSYDACLFGRCEVLAGDDEETRAKALVMWLWRTHNAVSVRVIGQHPPHGAAVDRRYPAYKACPGCWNVDVVNGEPAKLLTFHGQTTDIYPVYNVFNEKNVFGFILRNYLGQDGTKKASQLYEASPYLVPHAVADSSHEVSTIANGQMFLILSCAIAGVATLFAMVRQFTHRQRPMPPPCTCEDDLLEASLAIE